MLIFLSLGMFLEYLHAFRATWYLNVGEAETRRLMWTLAHAHGIGLSLLNMGFAATLPRLWDNLPTGIPFASKCITLANEVDELMQSDLVKIQAG